MKLKIQNAKELDTNAKVTLQASGKLGFSDGARKKMNIESGKFLVIATNEEDNTDENLYAWLEENDEGGGFKINKGGTYYNASTKPLFDKMGIDYNDKEKLVIYDILDFQYEDQKIFKLMKRVRKRAVKQKTGDTNN